MAALYQLVNQYRELQHIDVDDVDAETLHNTLEGLQGDIQAKAMNVAAYCANLDTFASNCDEAAKRMKERSQKIQRKADQVRAYLKTMMEAAAINKIEAPEFTLAIRKNPPALVIAPDAKIPEGFMLAPVTPPPKPNNAAIKDALKAGIMIDGCRLEQGTRLEIKT